MSVGLAVVALTDVTECAHEPIRAHAAGAVVQQRSTVGAAVTAYLWEATLHFLHFLVRKRSCMVRSVAAYSWKMKNTCTRDVLKCCVKLSKERTAWVSC